VPVTLSTHFEQLKISWEPKGRKFIVGILRVSPADNHVAGVDWLKETHATLFAAPKLAVPVVATVPVPQYISFRLIDRTPSSPILQPVCIFWNGVGSHHASVLYNFF
jgi:hypothetical protein